MSMKRLEELSRKIEKNGTMEYRSQLLVEYWTTASLMIQNKTLVSAEPTAAAPTAATAKALLSVHPSKSGVISKIIHSRFNKNCAYGTSCICPSGRKIPKEMQMVWLPEDSVPASLNFHCECFTKWITEPLGAKGI